MKIVKLKQHSNIPLYSKPYLNGVLFYYQFLDVNNSAREPTLCK
jgi:hypothetical protein